MFQDLGTVPLPMLVGRTYIYSSIACFPNFQKESRKFEKMETYQLGMTEETHLCV